MTVELVYAPTLALYRFNETHPLRPERFTLAVDLMRAWGLLDDAKPTSPARALVLEPSDPSRALVVQPAPVDDEDLLRVHCADYIFAVQQAGYGPEFWHGAFGIGDGDTPPFRDMHMASARVAGATMRALDHVLAGVCRRSFSPAGGLHHAQRDHAAGFCVYNDLAIAIARATALGSAERIAYVDVDVHHGDGVQAAFYSRADVLTVSVHESGRYLFPGTGRIEEMGEGQGAGFSVNLPLPPGAGDECFEAAFERVIAPAVRAFSPDAIVAQLGADSHLNDPLAHLNTTVAGQYATTKQLIGLADEVCGGRIAATGGGGYDTYSAVPRAWACAMAALLGVAAPAGLPESWREAVAQVAPEGEPPAPHATFEEPPRELWLQPGGNPLPETERTIERLRTAHPLLRDAG